MRLVALAVLLAACARPSITTVSVKHWPTKSFPIHLMASSEMNNCQLAALASAVSWIERMASRDLFKISVVDKDYVAFAEEPVPGSATVAPVKFFPDEPYKLGETRLVFYDVGPRIIHSSQIKVRGCSSWVMAHELVHMLGLDHVNDPNNLMFRMAMGGWRLTSKQVLQLRN